MTEKKEAKESPIISLEVVTALSIMKGDFNMKDLRNPLNRTENFEHPSGNVEGTEKHRFCKFYF